MFVDGLNLLCGIFHKAIVVVLVICVRFAMRECATHTLHMLKAANCAPTVVRNAGVFAEVPPGVDVLGIVLDQVQAYQLHFPQGSKSLTLLSFGQQLLTQILQQYWIVGMLCQPIQYLRLCLAENRWILRVGIGKLCTVPVIDRGPSNLIAVAHVLANQFYAPHLVVTIVPKILNPD